MRSTLSVLGASVLSGAAASFSVSQDLASVLAAVATTVMLVVAVLSYIDKRVDHKIRNHAQIQNAKYDLLLAKLEMLHDLIKKKT